MKKLIIILLSTLFFVSCKQAEINDAVVVEQINIVNKENHKYEVKFQTAPGSDEAYLYTNFRFQVGDTLVSFYQFFEGKSQDVRVIKKERDSLKNELITVKYYLQILQERLIIDSAKRR